MMQVNVEKLSPILMELQIEIPADEVTKEVEDAYSRLRKSARVRGFRKGKAPKAVLRQLYGPSIRADVAKRIMDDSLQTALREKSVQPLTQPNVEPAELKPKQPFSFKARFEVRPDIEKVEWKGLQAIKKDVEVTDELVDAEVEKLRNQHATEEPVEGRAAKEGDLANLNLKFEVNGKEESEDVDGIELGGGRILPFLDEGAIGMKVGESKEVTGSFPGNHPMAELRDKETKFVITLVELKERVLPKVDDELAKDCDHEDLASMKKALRAEVQKRLEQDAEEDLARQLVAKLCEKNPIVVPPSLVQQQSRMTQRELQMIAQMTGQDVNDPNLVRRVQADSETKVRAGLLMAEIARLEEIKVTEEDIEKGYEELAEQTGKNVARVKAEYRDKQKRDMLVGMILEDKVLTLMENAASISKPGDAPPAEAKADAQDGGDEGDEKTKKAAAKKTPKKTAAKKKAAKKDDD